MMRARIVVSSVAIVIAFFTFLVTALEAQAEEPANPFRISWEMVSHDKVGSTINAVFDVEITNAGSESLDQVNLRAVSLGQTIIENLVPPNSLAPDELYFGDLEPQESVVQSGILLSFDYGAEEPGVVWSLEYIDALGATQTTLVTQ